MLNHLIAVNNLEPVMKGYDLELPVDLDFIKELIFGKIADPDHPEKEVCTMTLLGLKNLLFITSSHHSLKN